jgi:peptide-methionine (S)-S-oxide reductase
MQGVWRVTAGYAGGQKNNPTYRSIGDHTETVRVEYDPEVVSYNDLLDVFFAEHDAYATSWSDQYASLILYTDEGQRRSAEQTASNMAAKSGKSLATRIESLGTFTPAEDYHQKFYLRRYRDLEAEFSAMYPDPRDFRRSTAAARVNAILGGYGRPEDVDRLGPELGLTEDALATIRAVAGRRMPRCAS